MNNLYDEIDQYVDAAAEVAFGGFLKALAAPVGDVALERVLAKHPEFETYRPGKQGNLIQTEARWLLAYWGANGSEKLQRLLGNTEEEK